MPKQYNVNIDIKSETSTSVAGTGFRHGLSRTKGWFHKFFVGRVRQHNRSFAFVERFKKRVGFGDWYSEKVIDEKTGKIIHECAEPLSVHQGHGSAKFSKLD